LGRRAPTRACPIQPFYIQMPFNSSKRAGLEKSAGRMDSRKKIQKFKTLYVTLTNVLSCETILSSLTQPIYLAQEKNSRKGIIDNLANSP